MSRFEKEDGDPEPNDSTKWDDAPHVKALRKTFLMQRIQKSPVLSVQFNHDAYVFEAKLKCRSMNKMRADDPGIDILEVSAHVMSEQSLKAAIAAWCLDLISSMNMDRRIELDVICVAEIDFDWDQPPTLWLAENIQAFARKVTGWVDPANVDRNKLHLVMREVEK